MPLRPSTSFFFVDVLSATPTLLPNLSIYRLSCDYLALLCCVVDHIRRWTTAFCRAEFFFAWCVCLSLRPTYLLIRIFLNCLPQQRQRQDKNEEQRRHSNSTFSSLSVILSIFCLRDHPYPVLFVARFKQKDQNRLEALQRHPQGHTHKDRTQAQKNFVLCLLVFWTLN
jgi:hypothetical protein